MLIIYVKFYLLTLILRIKKEGYVFSLLFYLKRNPFLQSFLLRNNLYLQTQLLLQLLNIPTFPSD